MRERLLLITDRRAGDVIARIAGALAQIPPGTAVVQVREKDLDGRSLVELVRAVVALAAGRARVLVNDRVDVAIAAGAHGVHLPESGMTVGEARTLLAPGALIGASVHDLAGARAKGDADFCLLGPIWDTPGKAPCGINVLAAVCREVAVPVFAVGGIDGRERAAAARTAGAHGVAAIRAVDRAAELL